MALGSQPIDAAVLDVLHVVTTHHRVVPVGDEDRAVGSDRDIAGTKVGVRRGNGILMPHLVTGAIGFDEECLYQPLAWLGVQQLSLVFLWEQIAFV